VGTASIALEHGATEDEAIAALLHDAAADPGPGELVKIRARFGNAVADIVAGCTDTDAPMATALRPSPRGPAARS
jgi:(p)ppGpp synthase/HD superfamily hydrolase